MSDPPSPPVPAPLPVPISGGLIGAQEFEPLLAQEEGSGGLAAGKVVVVHRRSTWLVLLLSGALIGSWTAIFYQRMLPRSSDPSPSRVRTVVLPSPQPGTPIKIEIASVSPPTDPSVLQADEFIPMPELASEPTPALTPISEKKEATPVIGFTPPQLPQPEAAPGAKPDETALAVADIKQEAARKSAERQKLLAARADLGEVERRRNAQAAQVQHQQEFLTAQLNATKRDAFRAELRQLLAQPAKADGAAILALAARYNVEPTPALEKSIARDLQSRGRAFARDPSRRIGLLRAHGLSEPAILGDLIVVELKDRVSRGGPRTKDQAILRAARILLAVQPPSLPITAAQAAATAAASRTDRDPR